MAEEGSPGHYRPGPPRRMGVSGFIKGPPLYSIDEIQRSPGVEEEDDHLYDRMHGVKSSSDDRELRKRLLAHPRNGGYISEGARAQTEDEDPSELYSRLVASSSVTAGGDSSLRTHQCSATSSGHMKRVKKEPAEGFMCEVCGIQVTSVRKQEHERSTLHIFNEKKKDTARRIVLPDSNRGVQILGRLGWSGETGLGVAEQGRIEPAKSILKLDTKGLGHKQPKARVTHFPPHIPVEEGKSAAERALEEFEKRKQEGKEERTSVMRRLEGQPESRQERKRREAKEKRQRDRIRREFHDNVPEGYEEYFR